MKAQIGQVSVNDPARARAIVERPKVKALLGTDYEAISNHLRERATTADGIGLAKSETAKAYGSYTDLVADPEVDVVYVASPHSEHREHALLAISAGKHVLVEKAFTRNAAEAREVVAAARKKFIDRKTSWTQPELDAWKDDAAAPATMKPSLRTDRKTSRSC